MPTKIEWAKEVWNPIAWTGETVFVERALAKPLRWEKPRRIFLCSMSDLWHRSVKREWVYQIMAVVALCQGRHTIIVTTKRAKRMKSFFDHLAGSAEPLERVARKLGYSFFYESKPVLQWPLTSLHLGISVSTQEDLDKNVDYLLDTPAAVRWLSIEPMLGPIDFRQTVCSDGDHLGPTLFNHGAGEGIDWVVIGCGSGPGRRPMNIEWAYDVVRQSREAGVPVFVKQLDIGGKVARDINEFPPELQVREYPKEMNR